MTRAQQIIEQMKEDQEVMDMSDHAALMFGIQQILERIDEVESKVDEIRDHVPNI